MSDRTFDEKKGVSDLGSVRKLTVQSCTIHVLILCAGRTRLIDVFAKRLWDHLLESK